MCLFVALSLYQSICFYLHVTNYICLLLFIYIYLSLSVCLSFSIFLSVYMNVIKFLIPCVSVDLYHQRPISSLCMLFKIYHNPKHLLYSAGLFHSARITRVGLTSNNLAFSVVRFNTSKLSRSFIPAVTRLWKDSS